MLTYFILLRRTLAAISLLLIIILSASCGRTPSPTATPVPTATPLPPGTPPGAPPPPPAIFPGEGLLRGVRPETYIADTCTYLRLRWDPANSAPGTIIAPIMYHAVAKKANRGNGDTLTPASYFQQTMAEAKRLGYQTITAEQAADFLERNAPIPKRSLLLIVDDRRLGTVEPFFLPVLQKNDWTVTLGWIIADTFERPDLVARLKRLNATGRLDIQSHGLRHLYMVDSTPEQKIREEITGPIPIFEQEFGRRPMAFVWPGGNFTPLTVQVAREAGYRLAFTVFSRGPLMFNWTPLGKEERAIDDPLMVLPRYWGYPGMIEELKSAADFGDAAGVFARQHYSAEAAWYKNACGGELPNQ